jgi:ribosomal protein S18 acetylase RimI-like enzyme
VEFTIVRAGVADWAAYAEIRLRSLGEMPEAYGSSFEREVAFPPATWQERISGSETLLAYVPGSSAAVGTATGLRGPGDDTTVVGMYVDPAVRRSGCAARLLDRLGESARADGGRRLLLHVLDSNPTAAGAYAAYGFTPTGLTFAMERDPEQVEIELAYRL